MRELKGRKVLLLTFSDNADHQDTMFGMYESLQEMADVKLMAIRHPRVPLQKSSNTWLTDCPKRPGICLKTFDLLTLWRIIQRIRKEKFDVIWFESLHVWNLPIQMFLRKKSKMIQVIHEVIPHEGDSAEKMVDKMNRILCKTADWIVLRNQTYLPLMTKRYGISEERVKFSELWRRYPPYRETKRTKRVLFFGRINPYKGVEDLLEIIRLCPEVSFDIVGRVDPQVERTVRTIGEEKNVTLKTGYVSDEEMTEAFQSADWVILPYQSASQSGVIIDAYKFGRPVICYKVGAIEEQVKEGESGYLIESGDREAFAAAIRRGLAMSDEAYEHLRRQAYEFGRRKYSSDGSAERFLKLLQEDRTEE